jgi:hypothetical protein
MLYLNGHLEIVQLYSLMQYEDSRKEFLMIQAIISAFGTALSAVFSFVPHLVGFLVILLVGWLVAWGVGKAVMLLLRRIGFDRLSDRMGLTNIERRMGIRMDTAEILGRIAFWFIFLIFLVPAADALGLPTVSNTLSALVGYLPNVFVAVLVVFLGTLFGIFVGDIVRGAARTTTIANPDLLGSIARWAIIAFSALIALEQLQIAPALITVLLTGVVAAAALACGLAFGLGGRDAAQRLLARGEGHLMANRPYDPSQIVQQARSDLTHSEQIGQQYVPPQVPPATYGTQQNVPPTSTTPPSYNEPRPQRPTTPRS